MIRLKTSRPMSSVPKKCARLGAESRISGWVSSGSYGARTSAKIAVKTISTRSAAETAPSGLRRIVCHSARIRLTLERAGVSRVTWTGIVAISVSLIPDPRVEPRVGKIDEQIQRDQRRRYQHHVGLHDRIVAVQDRLDGEPTHAREREDLLDHDCAGQQHA